MLLRRHCLKLNCNTAAVETLIHPREHAGGGSPFRDEGWRLELSLSPPVTGSKVSLGSDVTGKAASAEGNSGGEAVSPQQPRAGGG